MEGPIVLGPAALAGLALAYSFLTLLLQIANMAKGGAIATSVARTLGAGRTDEARSLACHALAVAAGALAGCSLAPGLGTRWAIS